MAQRFHGIYDAAQQDVYNQLRIKSGQQEAETLLIMQNREPRENDDIKFVFVEELSF